MMRLNHDPDVLAQSLAEPSRRALLENLRLGKKTVTQLVAATGLKQPNVSNHLAKMRQQGIVRAERVGRQVYYSLSTPFAEVMLRMLEFAANPLAREAARAHTTAPAPSENTGQAYREAGGAEMGSNQGPHTTETLVPALPPLRLDSLDSVDPAVPVQWRDEYLNAIMSGNEDAATNLVNGLLALRLPMETIYIDVFQWGVNHIGKLYQQGLTDEAHEHMASEITERMMAQVVHFYTPVVRASRRALLGCVAGNWHILGIRMLGDGLKELGWETVFLGANVPTPSFVSMAQTMHPDLVVITCAMEEQRDEALELLARLHLLRQNNPEASFQIAAGGHYFQENAEALAHLPIDFTASDLLDFIDAVKVRFPSHPYEQARASV